MKFGKLLFTVIGFCMAFVANTASAALVNLSPPQWPPIGSSGLGPVQFNVVSQSGTTSALGAHAYKTSPLLPNDGVSIFYAQNGFYGIEDRANWSFDFVIDPGSCTTCSAALYMDVNPGVGQTWASFGFLPLVAGLIQKDSWNLEMNFLETLAGVNFDPFLDGQYDFRLVISSRIQEFSSQNDITVIVGKGAQVPEPGSLALIGLGFAGMMLTRRRQKNGDSAMNMAAV